MPDRLVVVSGGGTGIGKAIATAFAADDDRVVILGRCTDVLNKARAEIESRLAAVADAWRRDLDTNLLTAVLLTSALLDHLHRPGGRLIMISSTAAQRGGSGTHSAGSYAAAKAGLPSLTTRVLS